MAVLVLILAVACRQGQKKGQVKAASVKYTCPMHSQIIRDEPGNCPICGMELVPLHTEVSGSDTVVQDSLKYLLKPADEVVTGRVKTVRAERGMRSDTTVLNGVINYNTSRLNSIAARVSGRIERLYIRYNYQPVSKGQKLMDLYSPDLANAQQELLFLKRNPDRELIEAARQKLRLLGATEAQINQVWRSGKVSYRFSIYSPYNGYVSGNQAGEAVPSAGSAMPAPAPVTASGGSGMGGMPESSSPSPAPVPDVPATGPISLSEGQYVSAGETLFRVADNDRVWAEFYINPAQRKVLKPGVRVQIHSENNPDQKVSSEISTVLPFYKAGADFSLARAVLANSSDIWKPGQLVTARIAGKNKEGNWLPRSSVLQMGTRYVAFVRRHGVFIPVNIKVEGTAGNWIDVGSSLGEEDEAALHAGFLVDSESFIKVKQNDNEKE